MKNLSFNCPKCGQHFEAAPELAGQQINCPSCGILFLAPKRQSQWWKHCVLVVLIAMIFAVREYKDGVARMRADAEQEAFLRSINPTRGESAFDTSERLKKEIEENVMSECSNYVGFTRIVDHYVVAEAEMDPTNWQPTATIDFVNQVGGIERTNLLFKVFIFDHQGMAVIDRAGMYLRQKKVDEAVQHLEAQYRNPQ